MLPQVPLERGTAKTPHLCHHGQDVPVPPEQDKFLRSQSVSTKDIDTPVPVQGIIYLVQIQEYLLEDLLPHVYNLLEKLGLEGGGPFSAAIL